MEPEVGARVLHESDLDKSLKGILIVEDDVDDARNLKVIVQNLGYKICGIAPSGKSALDLMKQVHCETSLALVNMTLKGSMDGIETAERISSEYTVNFVFLSGTDDAAARRRAGLNLRPHAIINKPFNLGIIESTIREAFESSVGIREDELASEIFEKRKSRRVKALDFPWESAYINVDGQPFQVILQNISRNGVGVLSEVALKTNVNYRIRIVLPPPNGPINALCMVRYSLANDVYTYYGMQLELAEHDVLPWEGYIKYRSQINS